MNKKSLEILQFETYLDAVKNSVGSKQYQTLWVMDAGIKKDITQGGMLSCAVYVSSILKLFNLIADKSATVKGLISGMKAAGWMIFDKKEIKAGDVIVWRRNKKGFNHQHIGFYIGKNQAISNSTKLRKVVRHSWDYEGKRKIIEVLRWPNW